MRRGLAKLTQRRGWEMGKSILGTHQAALVAHAEGWLNHINNGRCPDSIEGSETRDPECPVCQALIAAPITPTTLSTVKPPRNRRTRLRPDTEHKDCSHG